MTSIETILLVGFMIVVGFLPSVLIAVIGWKLTRKVKNSFVRIIVRAAVVSTAFAPTIYGHAGPMFAVWVIFLGTGADRVSYGLLPIGVIWVIIATFMLLWRNVRKRRVDGPTVQT